MPMTNKQTLLKFLQDQRLITLASVDEQNKPWVSNAYYSVDKNMNFFFVSPLDTAHSRNLKANSDIAFSIAWFDENDLSNRVAIQGTGICELVTKPSEVVSLLKNHYKYFPSWKDSVNYENIAKKLIESRPYVIRSKYIKFWNDELYGEEGVEEFTF